MIYLENETDIDLGFDYFEIEISDVLSDDGPRAFPAYFYFNKKIVNKNYMQNLKNFLGK